MFTLNNIVVLFCLINAVFWGLMPHNMHCELVSSMSNMSCPPHFVHLILGITFFVIAVVVGNLDYIQSLASNTIHVAGAVAESFMDVRGKFATSLREKLA